MSHIEKDLCRCGKHKLVTSVVCKDCFRKKGTNLSKRESNKRYSNRKKMPKEKTEISNETEIRCRYCGEPLDDFIGGTTHFCEKRPKKTRKKA